MTPDLSILTARSKDRKSRGFYRTAFQFTAVFIVMATPAAAQRHRARLSADAKRTYVFSSSLHPSSTFSCLCATMNKLLVAFLFLIFALVFTSMVVDMVEASASSTPLPSVSAGRTRVCVKCLNHKKCDRTLVIQKVCRRQLKGFFTDNLQNVCCNFPSASIHNGTKSFTYTGQQSCSSRKLRKIRQFCAGLHGRVSCSIKNRVNVAAKYAKFTCSFA